ncbi:MAG: hypothetical protein Q7P63_14275 [Verrucomicrobiota bacterium JB022]|nr:hypothetical protein [Verrucomicrobiota bacterium JB022]
MKVWVALSTGLLVGAVVGGTVAYSLHETEAPDPVEASTAPAEGRNLNKLLTALEDANVNLGQANRRITELEGEVEYWQDLAHNTPAVALEEEEAVNENGLTPDQQRRFERYNRGIDRRIEGRRRELNQVTKLEPWQEERLDFVMTQIRDQMEARMLARARGEDSPDADPWDTYNQELRNILTPEQMGTYQDYQADLRQGRLETMSNATMSRLSAGLGLDEGQKDQLYSAVYRAAEASFSQDEGPNFEAFGQALNQQLEQSLPPDQVAVIRERLENGFPGGPRR